MQFEDIKQIQDRVPGFMGISQGLDKSDPKKFILDAVEAMKKWDRAIATGQNARDNMGDSYDKLITSISNTKVAKLGAGIMSGLSEGMEADGNKLKAFTGELAKTGEAIYDADLNGPWAKFEISADEGARRRKAREDADATLAASRFQAAKKIFEQEKAELDLQRQIADAQSSGDIAKKKNLEDQLVVLKDLTKSEETLNITTEQATQLLQDQAAAQRALRDADPSKAAFRQKTLQDDKIASLRDRGRNRAADKLTEEQTHDARVRELIDNNLTPEAAAKVADAEARRRQRQQHLEKTGRRLISGARNPDGHKTGINAFNWSGNISNFTMDDKQFNQTGEIGGMHYGSQDSWLNHPWKKSEWQGPPVSTRDEDWSQVPGMNGSPPTPDRHTIHGAGAKPKPDGNKTSASNSLGDQMQKLISELTNTQKRTNTLLEQIASAGSVASKTAPQAQV